jgi:hypothetical protein
LVVSGPLWTVKGRSRCGRGRLQPGRLGGGCSPRRAREYAGGWVIRSAILSGAGEGARSATRGSHLIHMMVGLP